MKRDITEWIDWHRGEIAFGKILPGTKPWNHHMKEWGKLVRAWRKSNTLKGV